ncbi:M81 family metallopeptidase, partial [Burkholderia pseudomallei]|uniref:M81 family metallopeptidase n=1 Tax=Burkholderia pseudomallei TaxID=28450 RepID=UPI0035900D53
MQPPIGTLTSRSDSTPAPRARGAGVLSLRDVNVPIGGCIRAAHASGHALRPVVWGGACPSAHLTGVACVRRGGAIVRAASAGRVHRSATERCLRPSIG